MNDFESLHPEIWYVSDETWDWLTARLNEPPQDLPLLRDLLARPTPFTH